MATFVLQSVGMALGGPLGAAVGSAIGSFIDSAALNALFPQNFRQEGPRLEQSQTLTSQEGASLNRMWGRMRIGGEVIWATRFKEVQSTTKQGGKGSSPKVTSTSYAYYCSFAVALCEGVASTMGRIWADGKLLDQSQYTIRFYTGAADQAPDTFIELKEGVGNTPAYRGTCYVVFEEMNLEAFGRRIPQITVEVFKPLGAANSLETLTRGVTMIPASGEFVYGTKTYESVGFSDVYGPLVLFPKTTIENAHSGYGTTDFNRSLNTLEAGLPNVETVTLVVSWFGSDLRAADCTIKPKVEFKNKISKPTQWNVNGVDRFDADEVIRDIDGDPVYGGTPSDAVVIEAIAELKARGYRVVFYPFILMDQQAGNALPNPYSNNAATLGQPVLPWRGRVTCSPAPGYVGTVDKTATATTQINAFFDSTWGYRRMVLHYANLCALAGGVDAFMVGTELRGITSVRSSASAFPGVSRIVSLIGEVKAILPSAKVSYAADWSEYHSYRPSDGSGDVYFNMDPIWVAADMVCFDNYLPLSDWRSGSSHLDALSWDSIYDIDYLKSNIEGGELYNWYYASDADRDSQTRSPITDWVYGNKRVKEWWTNLHYNRPLGVVSGTPTTWAAQSKPIWFTEFGCPAVDKGTNQPNVFVDPKSSESFVPYYSSGVRDDLIQRRYTEATLQYWGTPANNPTSSVYGQTMIDVGNCSVWTWDARPFPEYPTLSSVWKDSTSYALGHWLNGRVGGAIGLADLVREICSIVGVSPDVTDLLNSSVPVQGFLVPDQSSPRDMLAPLMQVFNFDGIDSAGSIKFVAKDKGTVLTLTLDDLVLEGDIAALEWTDKQETELPNSMSLAYYDEGSDYQTASTNERKQTGGSLSVTKLSVPIVSTPTYMKAQSQSMLHEAWLGREAASLTLPPSLLRLEPGDSINIPMGNRILQVRIQSTDMGYERKVEAVRFGSDVFTKVAQPEPGNTQTPPPSQFGSSQLVVLDMPQLTINDDPGAPRVGVYQDPWPGGVAMYKKVGTTQFTLADIFSQKASMGYALTALGASQIVNLFNSSQSMNVTLQYGTLQSRDKEAVLNGENTVLVQLASGEWEIMSFLNATLLETGVYTISGLLRGLYGTEEVMLASSVAIGARLVVLDGNALQQMTWTMNDRGVVNTYRYGPQTVTSDSSQMQEYSASYKGVGLRPYSPAQLKGKRALPSNDLVVTWIRRTRVNGNSWEVVEVPLGEENERYNLRVLDAGGATVLRSVEGLTTPTFTYTTAMQTADFGSVQSSYKIEVAQLSTSYGEGSARRETISG
jgi:hypothetical protein